MRYFESYYNADTMVEVSADTARTLDSYVVEEGGPMRRYRRFIDNELDTIIYRGWTDPSEPLADLSQLAAGVPAQIHSPVEQLPEGTHRWRTWYVDSTGSVKKILEPEFAADGRFVKESLRSPDGELLSYTIYRYNANEDLVELITHAPDGTVTGRQDA